MGTESGDRGGFRWPRWRRLTTHLTYTVIQMVGCRTFGVVIDQSIALICAISCSAVLFLELTVDRLQSQDLAFGSPIAGNDPFGISITHQFPKRAAGKHSIAWVTVKHAVARSPLFHFPRVLCRYLGMAP